MVNNEFQEQNANSPFPFVSVNKDEPSSAIAAALNSEEYQSEVYALGFAKYQSQEPDLKDEEFLRFVKAKLQVDKIERSGSMQQNTLEKN